MTEEDMESYYRVRDHYKGWVCKLTHTRCVSGDCRRCGFASVAWVREIDWKEDEE